MLVILASSLERIYKLPPLANNICPDHPLAVLNLNNPKALTLAGFPVIPLPPSAYKT
nr:MAG: hypothetical protein [Bacteriophage sp.]